MYRKKKNTFFLKHLMRIVTLLFIQYSGSTDNDTCKDDPDYIGPFDKSCESWDTRDCTSKHWYLGDVEKRVKKN